MVFIDELIGFVGILFCFVIKKNDYP